MPKSQDSQDAPSPAGRRKKRRWPKVLGVFFVLLVLLALAINGPIARWLVGKVLSDQLAKQGLQGSVQVEGRLWSGFTLKEASFSGEDGGEIVKLTFQELGVDYSLPELLDKKIRRVHGRALAVEINLKESEKKKEPFEKPDFQKIAETLREIRTMVLPVEIDIESVEVTLNRPDPESGPLRLSLGALVHRAGRDEFAFSKLASNALGEDGLPEQDFVIRWGQDGLEVTTLKIVPDLALDGLDVRYPPGDPLSLAGSVQVGEARLDLAADDSGVLDLSLTGGPLTLDPLVARFAPDLELGGSVTTFGVAARNLWEDADQWTIRIELDGENLRLPNDGSLARFSLRLTGEDTIDLSVKAATNLELEANAPRPSLTNGSLADVWKNLPVALKVRAPSVHQAMRDAFAAIGREAPELAKIPEGAVVLEGTLATGGDLETSSAEMNWTIADLVYQESAVPDLKGTASLADGMASATVALAQPRPEESIDLNASWTLESRSYKGSLTIALPDPDWILPFIPGEGPNWRPTGPIDLAWSGNGSFPEDENEKPKHGGTLKLNGLTLTAPENTTTKISLAGNYDWPGMVELTTLDLRNGDLWLEGAVRWADERLTVHTLRLHDQGGPLANLEGSLPLTTATLAPKKFFAQEEALDLTLTSRELRLRRLAGLVPLELPEGFAATLSANLNIAGTPSRPLVNGSFKASEVLTPGPENLPPLAASIAFTTTDRTLKASGEITEPGGRVAALQASLPLEIDRLLNDPEQFKKLPLEARATIADFQLQRLQILSPAFKDAVGALNAQVTVGGTIGDPVLNGGVDLDLKSYPLPNTPFGQIDASKLAVRLDGERLVIDPSPITTAGGELILSGAVSLAADQPQLDLQLEARNALVWRNDSVLARTSGRLNLVGPLDQASIRGDLGLIESLVYQDIEIIPRGIPAAGAPKPQLPRFDADPGDLLAGLPKPVSDWTLDVGLSTKDPVLIRGNIAKGRITATTRIRGTVGNPRPEGSINLDNAEAALPLSKLTVRQGKIVLRPDQPFDPIIDVRGTTTINSNRISLYLFGPVSNPKYDLFSDPPLPESEILSLIATGTTTGGLQDQDTATMKAFQFAITELKRLLAKPGSNSVLQKFLETLEVVDIRMGDNDPFQGRQFTSATLQLNRFLFFSAAVDGDSQTRGVVMFAPQPDDPEARGVLPEPGGPGTRLPPSKIRVTGMRLFDPKTALGAIAGRLEYIEDRPATESRANDAAFLLERFLRQQGFISPDVSWSIPQPNRIVLAVEEGLRSSLGKISVRGEVKDELREGIRAQMKAAHQGRASLPGTAIPYLPENNAVGLKNATALLQSEGYWSARVVLDDTRRDPESGRTALDLTATSGPRHVLGAVDLAPAMPLRAELLAHLTALKYVGQVAKTKNISRVRNEVGEFYRDRGYQNAEVFMQAMHQNKVTRLSFRATVGKVFKVDQVSVEGLERTDPGRVQRRFARFPGETYNREAFDDQIRKLFGTGAFAGIRLEEETQLDGTIDVTLHFRESKPDGYQVYTGVGSFEGFILGAGYYHRNLFGRLWNLSTRAEYSGIGLLGEASVTDPFFLGYDLSFTPRAFIQTRTYEGYKKFESGLGLQLEWDVTDHYTVALEWETSFVTLSADGLPNSEIGPNNYFLNVLGLTHSYDRRNDIAVPTKGYYATLSTDVGISLGEESVSFARAEAQASYYHPITKKSHAAIGARAGVIVPSGSDNDLPVDLRFFLGGANSVRSFPARELGPEAANGLPRGGESYWVANAEYVHSIIGPLNGVFFLDAGSLNRDHGTMFSGETKYAAGIGLRLHIPIGAVRLEYGRSLNQGHNEPSGTFHFAIGAAF